MTPVQTIPITSGRSSFEGLAWQAVRATPHDFFQHAIVIPHFHLRWDSYRWPPSEEQQSNMQAWAEACGEVDDFIVETGGGFTTVRSTTTSPAEAAVKSR